MEREIVILSNLDVKILCYLTEERTITNLLDKFGFGFSQGKRHLNRLDKFIEIRKYGTFKFIKLNQKGKRVLEVLK